ncbi:flagellar assembly peptidoglycan hydrolase FlgJ [Marinobacter sp. LQ44]|uniref:flagellar assembly peptidoglycan hydrolase FlgJ n=1 Tax=unclassified Marinobacter TaxID=83889 RepID=UPI000718ED45|nr:flagellar assembly peptidoglycan hydrolase FlgJ [Marinobacter sp. LQ44]AMQ87630.1 flagellar rod assembly protein/muramidase FlgJ [Marinobacter sp. LQ44]
MQDYRVQQAEIYTDFSGLNALKTQARSDKQAALEQVARQFESLFLAEMLKSMRKAGEAFAEGNYLNSNESEFYRDMFDSQVSLSMSRGSGTGLAEALVRQLSRDVPGMASNGERLAGHKATLADYDRSMPAISRNLPEQLKAIDEMTRAAEQKQPEQTMTAAELPLTFESPEHFVAELMPFAERIGKESGIDPRLMVAQAALETGWGRHMIKGDGDQPSFNLFGIKADTRWGGDAVTITTTEFRGGVPMKERADFRAYPDYEASFRDYVDFLHSNPRYRDVLSSADQPEVFADKLQEAGYATDPEYGSKIRRIMNRDSLMTLSMNSDVPRE